MSMSQLNDPNDQEEAQNIHYGRFIAESHKSLH